MASRPDRSDAHLPPGEEARIAEEAREYFDGVAPKRHTKPQRSEHSDRYTDAFASSRGDGIPELDRLRGLEADTEKLVCQGSEPAVEYVETEYYKELDCIDKQHHTTGTGFIKVEGSNGSSSKLSSDDDTSGCHPSCRGNPATNEWIPSADMDIPVSHKPQRSDI
uniref:UPF0176 protein Pro_1101 n=1 Tax=Anthurium amnicola TaxID=1678845 RepID=A0A1D1Y6G5_9ARAE